MFLVKGRTGGLEHADEDGEGAEEASGQPNGATDGQADGDTMEGVTQT